MNLRRGLVWGFGQAMTALLLCGLAVGVASKLQGWESSTDGFLDKVAMALLLVTSASVAGLVVLGRPGYLVLQRRAEEGAIVLVSTVFWLAATFGGILVLIVLLDVHTIF